MTEETAGNASYCSALWEPHKTPTQSTLDWMDRVERTPLRRLLLRAPVAGIVAGHVAYTWSLYVLLSWLPSYFRDVQGLSIAHSGLFSAAPWLSMFAVGNVAGSAADWIIQRGVSVMTTRKVMQCSGLLVSAGSGAPVWSDRCTRVYMGGVHVELS